MRSKHYYGFIFFFVVNLNLLIKKKNALLNIRKFNNSIRLN